MLCICDSEQVKEAAIPPQLSQETAVQVLFIGKAVRVLRPPQASMLEDQLQAGPILEQLQATRKLDTGPFETAVDHIREQVGEPLQGLLTSVALPGLLASAALLGLQDFSRHTCMC